MRRDLWVTAVAVGLAGVLAGCSSPDDRSDPAGAGASDTAARSDDAGPPADEFAQLASVFGRDLSPQQDGSFGLDRGSLTGDGPPGSAEPVLRVAYPAGSVSPSSTREHGSPEGGMQVFLPFSAGPADSAHLRYWVRFPDDFEFVKGGKLPGLYGGTEVSGGEEPDGTDGFSTRLMWRSGGEGEVYLYGLGESGTSLGRGDWTWSPGQWLCVEQHVVLNAPDDDDGSVTVSVDGDEVFAEDGMRYRTVGDLRIDGLFFSTFYGGADPSWAPSADQHVDFAGFAVSAQPIGCG